MAVQTGTTSDVAASSEGEVILEARDVTKSFGGVQALRGASLQLRRGEVLALVGEGLTNEEIGARLFLSPLTAKTHVSRIMSKLAARDRVQLVIVAYETGLVTPGS